MAVKRRKIRKEKALATANKRASLGLAIGAAAGLVLFLIALCVAPITTPEQLAAAVKAQAGHRSLPAKTGEAAPQGLSPDASTSRGSGLVPTAGGSAAVPQDKSRYLSIGFDKLSSFPFEVTHQMMDENKTGLSASLETMRQIPEQVKALNGREVSLRGFMLPMKYEGQKATEFLLLKNQGLCCYGMPPKITEWVNVRMAGKGVRAIMDQPVVVCGIFHVGDVRENGDLVGIYRLDADRLNGPGE
jgi:hypothetical protein